MVKNNKDEKYFSFKDYLKDKILEFGTQYFKKYTKDIQRNFQKHIQKTIEKKIKREIKKVTYTSISITLISLAIIFILYGLFTALNQILNLPDFTTNIIFGTFLLIIGIIIFILK